MIKRRDPTHVVVDQWGVRVRANGVGLGFVEGHNLIGGILPERELMRVVGFSDSQVWYVDLVKCVIIHGPKHVPPSTV